MLAVCLSLFAENNPYSVNSAIRDPGLHGRCRSHCPYLDMDQDLSQLE